MRGEGLVTSMLYILAPRLCARLVRNASHDKPVVAIEKIVEECLDVGSESLGQRQDRAGWWSWSEILRQRDQGRDIDAPVRGFPAKYSLSSCLSPLDILPLGRVDAWRIDSFINGRWARQGRGGGDDLSVEILPELLDVGSCLALFVRLPHPCRQASHKGQGNSEDEEEIRGSLHPNPEVASQNPLKTNANRDQRFLPNEIANLEMPTVPCEGKRFTSCDGGW